MRGKYLKKPTKQLEIARRRIDFLFREAKNSFDSDKEKSRKFVRLARRIAMKHKIRFNQIQKKQFCKECLSYLVSGRNTRVRIHKSRLIYYCQECKSFKRHPLK